MDDPARMTIRRICESSQSHCDWPHCNRSCHHIAEQAVAQQLNELKANKQDSRSFSLAYLNLRTLIPGAFDTPHAPTLEQVWETTEKALKSFLAESIDFRNKVQLQFVSDGNVILALKAEIATLRAQVERRSQWFDKAATSRPWQRSAVRTRIDGMSVITIGEADKPHVILVLYGKGPEEAVAEADAALIVAAVNERASRVPPSHTIPSKGDAE